MWWAMPDASPPKNRIPFWFSDETSRRRKLCDLLVPSIGEVLEEFYDWLMATEQGRRFVEPSQVASLKQAQHRYWDQFFQSQRDTGYIESRQRVGAANAENDLPAGVYSNWLQKIEELFVERLEAVAEDDDVPLLRDSLNALIQADTITVFGAYMTRRETLLHAYVQHANSIAQGDYRTDIVLRGDRDVLGAALQGVTTALREVSDVSEAISTGNLDVRVEVKGPDDLLAPAINSMVATLKDAAQQANAIAAGDYSADIQPRGDGDELGIALQAMTSALRTSTEELAQTNWIQSGVARMNQLVLGESELGSLTTIAVTELASFIGASVGTVYVLGQGAEEPLLTLRGSYAYSPGDGPAKPIRIGEGLVGQVARDGKQIIIQDVPKDYIRVASSLGETLPRNICVAPLVFERSVCGVVEIASLEPLTQLELEYLEQACGVIAIGIEIANVQQELAIQREELQVTNEELMEQSAALEQSQQELLTQQRELETTNTDLETQIARVTTSEQRLQLQEAELRNTNEGLESANRLLESRNQEVERAGIELSERAKELALASKYKSEFLANMSHELRTPLNSLLLLARSLRDNTERNLTEDQQQSAAVIYESGSDLLNLINEILDLSKIEAGQMTLTRDHVAVAELAQFVQSQFQHMAQSRQLTLEVTIADDAVKQITTDLQRVQQVIKNLVANSLKFTDSGSICVTFSAPDANVDLSGSGLDGRQAVAISVADTGIGIAPDMQRVIFEAFQQADTGDRRRYGGTGLGLSICRELVTLLGGEIQLHSELGKGSTFTVYLPHVASVTKATSQHPHTPARPRPKVLPAAAAIKPQQQARSGVEDDRETISDSDNVILMVEDDIRFAHILMKHVRQRGFKCLAAVTGEEGIALATAHQPDGIILDIHLPNMDGWAVLSALKQSIDTRHIPVHVASVESPNADNLRIGAIGHVSKPAQREDIEAMLERIEQASATAEKCVLVVEDDSTVRKETRRLIGNGTVSVVEAETGTEALEFLSARRFDLIILDLGLPDMPGLEILRRASTESGTLPPVIVYTVRELTRDEEMELRNYTESIIIKDVRSSERLVDEVALFLHRVVSELPESKRRIIRHLHESDRALTGKKVLIVEDDMRTMFAMVKLLASNGMVPVKAENGQRALEILEQDDEVQVVLMDMMMPVMDGYETSRRLRADARWSKLPIIALTAKAMKADRAKCIEAGATDYLSKPVDPDRLMSLMRVWLCR